MICGSDFIFYEGNSYLIKLRSKYNLAVKMKSI